MYILNTSFMVEYEVHDHWLDTFRNRFLPHLRQLGFTELIFTKVISNDQEGHFTYSLQIPMQDLSRYEEFTGEILSEYAAVYRPVFGEKVLWFGSLLKKIES
ncbi:MAG: DUF4286 family protein [Rikenellaceae bacterium]|nr:DUF4286 family protein [Rikenellaceae bacterium]